MIINLLRDQLHVLPGQAFNGFASTTIGRASNTVYMNSTGIVQQTQGSRHSADVTPNSINIQSWSGSGILMSQPIVDATPYRVKASIAGNSTVAHLVVGYAPASPTGLNDLITKVVSFPLFDYEAGQAFGKFDEVILMPGLDIGDPDYGKPIAFGLACSKSTGSPRVTFNISVQNLAKTAPQFAASMS